MKPEEGGLVTEKKSIVKRSRNLEATKEAILMAAQEEFAAAPFRSVNVRAIAKRAGVDPALLNRYYGSKKELFEAALHALHAEAQLFKGVDRENLISALLPKESSESQERLLNVGSQSMTDPEVRLIIQNASMKYYVNTLAKIIGGQNSTHKSMIITSMIMGYVIANRFVFSEPFKEATVGQKETFAKAIQMVLDE